jgi:hypothetical protein
MCSAETSKAELAGGAFRRLFCSFRPSHLLDLNQPSNRLRTVTSDSSGCPFRNVVMVGALRIFYSRRAYDRSRFVDAGSCAAQRR